MLYYNCREKSIVTIGPKGYGSMKITKNTLKITLFLLGITAMMHICADNRIVIQLAHAPDDALQQSYADAQKESLTEKFTLLATKTPGQISQQLVKNNLRTLLRPELSGFTAIYGGYMDISGPDGLLSFPLRHVSPKIYIAITPEIKLVQVKGKTFSHAEYSVNPDIETELYSYEKKEDTKKQIYWEVRKINLPQDKTINPITLVIFSKPKNLFVKTGNMLATDIKQLVLPDIYVVGTSNKEKILLQLLEIRNYFEPITMQKKKATDNTVQQIITNF